MAAKDRKVAFLEGFGHAVREAREKHGWSQEELGFEAELDRTYISGIERGVRNPTLESVHRIASALKVSPSTLVKRAETGA